jgi:hypothetical protein
MTGSQSKRPGPSAWSGIRQGAGIVAISAVLFALLYVAWQYRNFLEMRRHTTGESFIQDDALVGYRLKPHSAFTSLDSGYSAFASNEGLRSANRDVDSRGESAVLVAGCSFMWGDGVQYEATFPAVLGQALDLKVDNAAVPSYSLLQAVLTIRMLADKKPQLVILGFFDDQLPRSLSPCAPSLNGFCRKAPYLAYDTQRQTLVAEPPLSLPYDAAAVTERYYLAKHFDAAYLKYAVWEDYLKITRQDANALRARALAAFHAHATDAQAFDSLLGELSRLMADRGTKLLFVHMPYPEAVRPLEAQLRTLVDKYTSPTFVFVDCADFLAGEKESLVVSAQNHHPNALYFTAMVEALTPRIRQLLQP